MTDRQTVYPAAIPLDTDILSLQRNLMVALGYLAQAVVGTGTVIDGLACSPTSPASLTVNVGPGSIFSLQEIDQNSWGSLSADTNPLVKIGINAEGSTPFTLTAPVTSGQSINYLIEAAFQESDATPVVLPYYNASNPSQPYSGPNNSGTAQDTQRIERVQLQLKAGTPANTGTQATPAVDSGWVGVWVVTVNYGQTQITASNISLYPSAPIIPWKLGPGFGPGFTTQVIFSTAGAWSWTVPPGVTRLRLSLNGGGGGGGATSYGTSAGGGGGSGGYGQVVLSVTPGQTLSGSVGAGGIAGTGSSNGGTGGATTCTTFGLTAYGGDGGQGTSSSSVGLGGAGAGTTGTFGIIGNANLAGGNGVSFGNVYMGGIGTASASGIGGPMQPNIASAGNSATFFGQGGNGGAGNGSVGHNGGSGGGGSVSIEY